MLSRLTTEIDSRPLGLARLVVGVAALIRSIVAWPVLTALTEPEILRVPYADWALDPTMPLVVSIVAVWFVSALLFTFGWKLALSGPALLLAIVTTLSLDEQTYSNHLYLMAWLILLMTIADAGAGLSVTKRDRRVVRWPVLLIMAQLSVVYGFSGLTKLNDRFLSGATLAGVLRDGIIPFPDSLRTPALLSALAGLVVVAELFTAMTIWHHRWRPTAFILGLGLHLSITLLMASTGELFVFSLEMLALYPLFLGPGELMIRASDRSDWSQRIRRFDLLGMAKFVDGEGNHHDLALAHRGRITHGAAAHTRILEHLVPWLWIAPLLRLPGISHLHDRLHHPREAQQAVSSRGPL